MFRARIHALGLSFPPAEYWVYPGIFKTLIQLSRYHGSCICATSIPLPPTVLVKMLEAATLCCRLAWIKEMVHTTSCLATSSSSLLSAYLPSSGLTPRGVKIASPTLLKGRQFSLSSAAMDDELILSTRRTPLDSTLCSYTLHSPIPSSAYGAVTDTAPYLPQGLGTRPPLSCKREEHPGPLS